MSDLKYAVIGAGAMGYRYGILLQDLGRKVDFIDTWEPGIEAVKQQGGVWVSRDHEDRHLVGVNLFRPENYQGDPDVWIVFMKQMQLADMLQRCAHLFREHQVVFSAMNGWGHFEKLAQYFSADRIYGGTAIIATVLNGPGDVDFIGKRGAGSMNMCAMSEQVTDIEKRIAQDFTDAQMNPQITTDFKGTCLAKIVFNSVVNSLCTMYQIRMGEFIAYPGALEMTKQLVSEAYAACEAAGIPMINSVDEEVESIEYASRVGNPLHYPSMYQDMTNGRPTEVDYINGFIAELGRQHGVDCRTHAFLTHGVHLAERAFQIHRAQN